MTPDLKRLCDAAAMALERNMGHTLPGTRRANQVAAEAIVRAVLMELREVSGETKGYREGLWSRRNIDAMVRDILSEPAEA